MGGFAAMLVMAKIGGEPERVKGRMDKKEGVAGRGTPMKKYNGPLLYYNVTSLRVMILCNSSSSIVYLRVEWAAYKRMGACRNR